MSFPHEEKKKRSRSRKRSLSISETVIAITQVKTKKKKRIEAMADDDWKMIEKGTFIFNENNFWFKKIRFFWHHEIRRFSSFFSTKKSYKRALVIRLNV